jgi:hypothetical protein
VGHCGWRGWADQLNESLRQPITAEQKRQWHEERKRREAERVAAVAKALAPFTASELWHELNRRMAEEQRQQWRLWGIPDAWQDYLELGYTPQYSQSIPTPAYTIPYFHNSPNGKQFKTMQYRLTDAPNPNDRYRFEFGLQAAYYETRPDQPEGEIAIVAEGAKKAMVFQIHARPGNNTSVYAIPSKSSFCKIQDILKERERVYIVLDPDAESDARKLAALVGKNARIVKLHVKLDDGILLHGLDRAALGAAFKWADRIKS